MVVWRIVLAWKNDHRFEASICSARAWVWELLPPVSEIARQRRQDGDQQRNLLVAALDVAVVVRAFHPQFLPR